MLRRHRSIRLSGRGRSPGGIEGAPLKPLLPVSGVFGPTLYVAPADSPVGELVTVTKAAEVRGVAPSTLHRWLGDGFIAGEQITPGAPWRIRLTDELRSKFVEEAPQGWLPMLEATIALGVSRQTVLQRVKHGELEAVHVRLGRRKAYGSRFLRPTAACSTGLKEWRGQCDGASKHALMSPSSTHS